MDLIDILLGAKLGGGGSSTFVPSFGTVASVSLGTTWSGNDPYTSTVTVTGYTVTVKTMVSVLPSTAVLTQMLADGTTNIYITNNNGTLTATALGAAPTQATTLTVLCSESDQAAAIGALPAIVGDGVIETLQANDLTDAVNLLGTDVSDAKNAISQNKESIADTQSMIATVEATTTASKNYSVGDLLVYDGKLYKVTSAIATGATIIVGSNVTQTTVEDQLGSGGGSGGAVDDVQINGTSIVDENGVANVPVGDATHLGVYTVQGYSRYGLVVNNGDLRIEPSDVPMIKNPFVFVATSHRPIVPQTQHLATFYGLAKAAGDTTMPSSSNAVGTYTEEAKAAIQSMLGVAGIVGTVEGATASKAYAVGDAFLHAGALYKATASIASGDAITPGTNCTQTTLISIIKGE